MNLAFTIAVALVSTQLYLAGNRFIKPLRVAWKALSYGLWENQDQGRSAEVEKAMLDVKLANASSGIQFMNCLFGAGLLAALCVAMIFEQSSSSMESFIWMLCGWHALTLPFSSGSVPLTERRLQGVVVAAHVVMDVRIIYYPVDNPMFFAAAGIRILMRLALGLALLDSRLNFLLNLCSSTVSLWKSPYVAAGCFKELQTSLTVRHCAVEIAVCLGIHVICVLVESFVRDRVISLCDAEGLHESLEQNLRSSRSLLSALCDADVQLDAKLVVLGPCVKLEALFMTALSGLKLAGKSFLEFIANDVDKEVFCNFMSCLDVSDDDLDTSYPMARSTHLKLRGPYDTQFRAELFLVRVHGSAGAGGLQYLMGIKEQEELDDQEERVDRDREEHAVPTWKSLPALDEGAESTDMPLISPHEKVLPELEHVTLEVDGWDKDLPVRRIVVSCKSRWLLRDLTPASAFAQISPRLLMAAVRHSCGQTPEETVIGDVNVHVRLPEDLLKQANRAELLCHAEEVNIVSLKFTAGEILR